MSSTPYHFTRPGANGRWLVVHQVPGASAVAVDQDCLTMQAAEREANWLNAERDRQQRALATERQQLGWRKLPAGWAA